MVDTIRRILIKHPKNAYKDQLTVDHQSPQLKYFGVPDHEKALADFGTFAELLELVKIITPILSDNEINISVVTPISPTLWPNRVLPLTTVFL